MVDASAVLAWLQDEPGSEAAEPYLMDGIIGAANWSEVLQKARQHGAPIGLVASLLSSFGLAVADVTAEDADRAADLWERSSVLSFADRLCLALGQRLALPVVTADAGWGSVDGVPHIIVIR